MITLKQAYDIAKEFKINLQVISLYEFHTGLNIELEHKNITNNDLNLTAKIVISHLQEFPDYYKRLIKMEKQAKKYWSNKIKPNIFI